MRESWTRGPHASKEWVDGRVAERRRKMGSLREVAFLMLLYLVAFIHSNSRLVR